MKKFLAFALLLSLGLFTLGCGGEKAAPKKNDKPAVETKEGEKAPETKEGEKAPEGTETPPPPKAD